VAPHAPRQCAQAVVGDVGEALIIEYLRKAGGDVDACVNAMLDANVATG